MYYIILIHLFTDLELLVNSRSPISKKTCNLMSYYFAGFFINCAWFFSLFYIVLNQKVYFIVVFYYYGLILVVCGVIVEV